MKRTADGPTRMTFEQATASYEAWLGAQLPVVQDDLLHKHEAMRRSAFRFLRGTYYRWLQGWLRLGGPVAAGKEVLAVGDLHIENFGTWRDAEGRLVWGINDFDEACRLPYTQDLVRLAVSVRLAIAEACLPTGAKEADDAILAGYREGLEGGGQPFVLAERWPALLRLAAARLTDPGAFWERLEALPTLAAQAVPESALRAIGSLLPAECLAVRYCARRAGLGSLGCPRFVAVAEWRGGKVAREAKAVARSAELWLRPREVEPRDTYREVLSRVVRCPDPFFVAKRRWIVRRLAPDCSRIELAELRREQDILRLLHAMGRETANVHLGSASAQALLIDLTSQAKGWLRDTADELLPQLEKDWQAWQAAGDEIGENRA